MIDLIEACKIASNNISDKCRIIGYMEMSDKIIFDIVSRRWDGKSDDCPVGGYTYYVDKIDGNFYSVMTDDIIKQMLNEKKNNMLKINEVDISVYLSEEDAKFMKEIKAKEKKDS